MVIRLDLAIRSGHMSLISKKLPNKIAESAIIQASDRQAFPTVPELLSGKKRLTSALSSYSFLMYSHNDLFLGSTAGLTVSLTKHSS